MRITGVPKVVTATDNIIFLADGFKVGYDVWNIGKEIYNNNKEYDPNKECTGNCILLEEIVITPNKNDD